MHCFKLSRVCLNNQKVRLYSCHWSFHNNYFFNAILDKRKNVYHRNTNAFDITKRHFSLQSTFDSFAKTQAGVFKFISESAPVEYIQKFLITLHDTSGLPWWATIVLGSIILRSCITVPLAIYQYHVFARIENISKEMKGIAEELKKEVGIAMKLYNWDERTAKFHFKKSLKKQWNNLIVRDNCHPFKGSLLIWIQFPLWISFSVALRNLVYMLPSLDIEAQLRFIELSVGGFGWIPNLTQPDATFILPVILGILNLSIIEIQALSKVRQPTKFQSRITNFFRGVSLLMIPIASVVPSCLALYWTTSSAFGLVQNLVLLSPKVRRFCKIPEVPSELSNPYTYIASGLKNKLSVIPGLSEVNLNKSDKKYLCIFICTTSCYFIRLQVNIAM